MPAGRNVEVELVYELAEPGDVGRFLAAEHLGPFAASGSARPVQVEDRYVDTADAALARAGFAARLRRRTGQTILSVKTRAADRGALQRRTELEGPADMSLDAAGWPPSNARALVLELCGDAPLREIVTIRQVRRTRDLRADETRAELSLDDVEIVQSGTVVSRFVELEVELTDGDETPLRELALALESDGGLVPAGTSKLERALDAIEIAAPGRPAGGRRSRRTIEPPHDQAPEEAIREANSPAAKPAAGQPGPAQPAAAASEATPAPSSPKGPGVLAEDVLGEAGRKVLAFHYGRLLAREAGARDGSKPEDLKSMRVATRRMRAAWRVFEDGFRRPRTRRLRERLRDVAGRLGAVRDIDVLIDGLEAYRQELSRAEAAGLEPLVKDWRRERESRREELVALFDSDEYRRFVEEYARFLGTAGASALVEAGPAEPSRVRDTAGSRIWLAYEHVRAFEPLVPGADVTTLHQLRIGTKRLRYTMEFFREALGPDTAGLIARAVVVQDHLGLLHDADVTASLARTFLAEHGGDLKRGETRAIGGYLASRESEVARLHGDFDAPWKGLVEAEFRSGLGRAVGAL